MKTIWLGCLGALVALAGSILPAAALAGPPEAPEEPEPRLVLVREGLRALDGAAH